MDRRRFLQHLAATTASVNALSVLVDADEKRPPEMGRSERANIEGHTSVCAFTRDGVRWEVYEDLRIRDGVITFVSSQITRALAKSAEASFPDEGPRFLGLKPEDLGMAGRDLLAEMLL